MAAPDRSNYTSKRQSHTRGAAAASIDLDLPAAPAGTRHVIDSIWVYAIGTITAFDIQVLNAAAQIIGRCGGQVNAAALPLHTPVMGPIVCDEADATQLLVTATGATRTDVTVNLHLE